METGGLGGEAEVVNQKWGVLHAWLGERIWRHFHSKLLNSCILQNVFLLSLFANTWQSREFFGPIPSPSASWTGSVLSLRHVQGCSNV